MCSEHDRHARSDFNFGVPLRRICYDAATSRPSTPHTLKLGRCFDPMLASRLPDAPFHPYFTKVGTRELKLKLGRNMKKALRFL